MLQGFSDQLELRIEKAKSLEGGISGDLRHEKNVFVATKADLKPLIKDLRREKCDKEVLDHLFVIVTYCMLKEYIRANDVYMKLCIGNSPWPMGVTSIGIHERSARTKIY